MKKITKSKTASRSAVVTLLLIAIFSFCTFTVNAQINFTGSAYTQNFNSLASTGTNNVWSNNSTLTGWFLFRQPAPGTAITAYNADAGGSNAGSFISYGAASSAERAFGSAGSGGAYFGSPSTGAIAGWLAVAFTNTSGSTINQATINFNGEQWRNGGNATAQPMVLEYGFGASFTTVASWITPGGNFDWTSVVNTATAAAVDGNTAGLIVNKGGTLSSLNWTNGSLLWIRWVERNDAANDHGLAIDDFSLATSVTPGTPVVTIAAQDPNAAETASDPGTFRISRTGATTASLTVNYTISGSADATDYAPALTGSVVVGIGQSFVDITIAPVDDADAEGNQTVILTINDAAAYDPGSPAAATVTIADNDVIVTTTKIHTIQGNSSNQLPNISGSGAHNDRSPLEGQTVTIQGIVTAVYNDLNAFFVQEENADADADPSTSEGIFVFTGSDPTVSEGDLVTVTGAVDEFFGMTQIDNDNANFSVTVNGVGLTLPSPAVIDLPIAPNQDVDDFYEQFEGMRVQFQDKMVVSEYFEVARFGQIVLTENSRPFQYSHTDNTPTNAEYLAFQNNLARRTIILDDENNTQNAPLTAPAPGNVFFFPRPNGFSIGTQGNNYFRGGDAVNNLTGVLHWSFAGFTGTDAWRIRPVHSNPVQFTVENARAATPANPGGNIKVSCFNVLNYFTTIDNGSAIAGPTGNLQEGRGADSQDELTRQTQKMVQALKGINADVFGLTELENNGGNAGANGGALKAIVDALNAEVGAGTYNFISTGNVGTDAITAGIIYKTTNVAPLGTTAILNTAAFVDPNNTGTQRNRPAVAATFEVINNSNPDFGGVFTVVVNHLKSKGAGGETGLDADQNDGQGNWNDTRAKAAQALAAWLATDPTGSHDPDFLIMGDLNSYKGEKPITNFRNAGYHDLLETFNGNNAYSYVFDGQLGYLDHALANDSLTAQVTGVTEWHINADEVSVFDYNNTADDGAGEDDFEAKPAGNNLFEANAFRTSDHDPVVIYLNLKAPVQCALNLSINATNASCAGCADGIAAVDVTGGTAPYTYTWTNNITGGTINIAASKDNSIYEETVTNSNGAGQYVLAGMTNAGFRNRALLAFDIANNVPSGAAVTNATLQMTVTHTSGASGPQSHSIYKILQNWGEGSSVNDSQPGQGSPAATNDATWIKTFFPSSDWTSSGGSFNASSSAATTVDNPAVYTWSSPQMVSDVQSWLSNPALNFGWLLKSDETGNRQAKRYGSKENVITSNRPVLTVNYGSGTIGNASSISGLAPGTYTVTVTDANGCTAMTNVTIGVIAITPATPFTQEITSYRGAFAPAPEKMWTDSWVNWDPQNTVYGATTVNVSGHITSNTVWTNNNVYLLQSLVYVDSLVTLTIQPGTVIRGNSGTNASLIVKRGGKLIAEGNECNPIVFTSNRAPGARQTGDWGGIILLGKARNNAIGGLLPIEGLTATPDHQHGGTDNSDNSGILKYVRIEYGGFVFAPNNEINGLTMGSVGSGTTIDYVQASFINDDAFEWFGGTVNAKHLVAFRCLDDDFDTDFGFSGTVQYGLAVKDPAVSDVPAVSTSEGFESDNDPTGTNESLLPKTSAKFYNITQIGAFRCASNTAGSGVTPTAVGFQRAARIRRNSDLKIVNSILMNNWRGIHFDGALALANVDQDSLIFRNNIIAGDFSTSWTGAYTNPAKSVAAFDATSRTRLFNAAYANDSLNSCAVLTNAWSFTNPDYRPNTGGDGAIVIDPTNLSSGADVTPFIEIDGGLFTANQSVDFLADVLENGGGSTTGSVTVTIPKLSGWSIAVEGITLVPGGATVSGISNSSNVNGGTANSNGNWNFRDDGTNIIATSKPGVVIEKFGFVQLGFTATRLAGTSGGTNQNLSVNVGGGGDVTPANNGTVTIFSAN